LAGFPLTRKEIKQCKQADSVRGTYLDQFLTTILSNQFHLFIGRKRNERKILLETAIDSAICAALSHDVPGTADELVILALLEKIIKFLIEFLLIDSEPILLVEIQLKE
jgi:hypothetical protein